jgi:hypothetical protein
MDHDLESVRPPKIGGTLPHDEYIRVLYSIAKSLKRLADAIERGDHLSKPEQD